MAHLVALVSLLWILAHQVAADEARFVQSVCDRCSCRAPNQESAEIDSVSCSLIAIKPEDTAFLSQQHQPTLRIRSLSLTCNDARLASVISSETIGALATLEELRVENCDLSSGLTSLSFQGMTKLKTLSIVNCVLPQDPKEMEATSYLASILSLESLSLIGCKLSSVPALPRWRHLRYLNISNNNLHSLDLRQGSLSSGDGRGGPEQFSMRPAESVSSGLSSDEKEGDDGLTSGLTVLDASHNPMTSLPTSAIVLSPRLERLVLQGVSLTDFSLPDNFRLPELRILDVKDSRLAAFKFPRLCACVKLEELYLGGSGAPVVFEGLSCLRNLTRLTLVKLGLNSSLWEQLQSLQLYRLLLSENGITSVDTRRLPKLRTLDLGGNQIAHINASSSFANLPELRFLNISFNLISDLPVDCFHGTADLGYLDASNNKLTQVKSRTFSGLTNLFYLSLAQNDISSMGFTVFNDSVSMKWLFLQYNRIQSLPRLNNMKNLLWLNVSYNQIKMIEPRDLIGFRKLTVLHANNNLVQRIKSDIFSKTPSLLQVWLNDNRIDFVGNLGDHAHLRDLRLQNNKISDFLTGSPFLRLKALQLLSLDNNEITRIRRYTIPPSIRFLFLSSNSISWIEPHSFANLPRLEFVYLENNKKILTLPLTAINNFRSNSPKPQFHVRFNQWLCDCNMAYLKLLFERRQDFILFLKFYPFFHGLELTACDLVYGNTTYSKFKDVPLSQFACEYAEPYCALGCSCCDTSRMHADPKCTCQLTCPVGCSCYVAGAAMLKTYYHIRCGAKNLDSVPERIPTKAVNLFLDGNNISSISNNDFYHLGELERLYLNSSHLEILHNETFLNCTLLQYLHLDHNLLTVVHSDMFKGLSRLSHLYLHHNKIRVVYSRLFDHLTSVRVVTLQQNRLVRVGSSLDGVPRSLSTLTLAENPWSCDCEESKHLYDLLHFNFKVIVDRDYVCCFISDNTLMVEMQINDVDAFPSMLIVPNMLYENTMMSETSTTNRVVSQPADTGQRNFSNHACQPVLTLDFSTRCRDQNYTAGNLGKSLQGTPAAIVVLLCMTVFLSIAAILVVFTIFKRKELQALAYVKLGIRVFDKKIQIDEQDKGTKAFDAFISYSSKDDEFVACTLVPALEDPKKGYRVCVHYRDFPVGSTITDTICKAIESSSRTILLLSQNFLKSEWCRFEFQTAHRHILREGSHRLIIVLYGHVPGEMLDPDLKVHLKSRSYLKFEDPYFWEKLYFSLPDIRQRNMDQGREIEGREERKEEDIQAMAAVRAMKILAGKPND